MAATMLFGSVSAQDLQKNIFGVRAGANLSTLNTVLELNHKISFNAGVSYECLLTNKAPLYLESGLYFSDKGYKNTYVWEDYNEIETLKASLNYLQIPLMLNYKFNISKSFAIYPSVGFYYAFAVAGTEEYTYEYDGDSDSEFYKIFEDGGGDYEYKRSDFGYRLSLSFALKRVVLGVGYEGGLLPIIKDAVKAKNSNLYVSLGVNF